MMQLMQHLFLCEGNTHPFTIEMYITRNTDAMRLKQTLFIKETKVKNICKKISL